MTFLSFWTSFSHLSYTNSGSTQSYFNSLKSREVLQYIEQYSYGFSTKTQKELEDAFVKSIAESLWDKYSVYFTPDEASDFEETLHGDFEGIGAVVSENPKWVMASRIIPGSPAEKYGLKAGDVITHVGATHIAWMSSSEAVELIRWPKGTEVQLTLIRAKDGSEESLTIKRWVVVVPTILGKTLSGSVGYIQMALFGEKTAQEFEREYRTLAASGEVAGYIIDLRQNGGGYLDAAIDILSYFLKSDIPGIITKGNLPSDNVTYFTSKKLLHDENIPLIVLVDELSASASEILAWALQDYDRALIVGEKTYGKWSVQSPFSLSDGSMIKLTTAKWFTPKDRSIDGKGIAPDIRVGLEYEDIKNQYDRQLEAAQKLIEEMIREKKSVQMLRNEYKSWATF